MWRPPIIIKWTTGVPGVLSDVKVGNYYIFLSPNNRGKRTTKTISSIIVELHEEGHTHLPFRTRVHRYPSTGNRCCKFVHSHYGSLEKFLQDDTLHDDFVLNVVNKGTCFIDHVPKLVLSKPVSPGDSIPLDSDSVV
jgi:hypothetical protein